MEGSTRYEWSGESRFSHPRLQPRLSVIHGHDRQDDAAAAPPGPPGPSWIRHPPGPPPTGPLFTGHYHQTDKDLEYNEMKTFANGG